MKMIPSLARIALVTLFPGCAFVLAQTVTDRVTQEIDSRSFVSLPGTVNPRANAQYDVGRVNAGTKMNGITIYFKLSAEQKSELDALVKAQQTLGSSYYHKWLSPEEYASRFGLSDNDLAKIQSWLEQQGFSVDRVANSHNSISLSGTISQVSAGTSGIPTGSYSITIDGQDSSDSSLTATASMTLLID